MEVFVCELSLSCENWTFHYVYWVLKNAIFTAM